MKTLIRGKIKEYLARAEALKTHIQKNEEHRSRRAVGANGNASGGTGGSGKRYTNLLNRLQARQCG